MKALDKATELTPEYPETVDSHRRPEVIADALALASSLHKPITGA